MEIQLSKGGLGRNKIVCEVCWADCVRGLVQNVC